MDDRSGRTAGQLKRSVGFYGLMMVSLGSIIGSGWLLGALNAAQLAGPASVLVKTGETATFTATVAGTLGVSAPLPASNRYNHN